MPNRLAAEQSPYLLQHANNPVDWYPWGDDAFARARAADRPIFLSVGYSTCHWCHVMEHESFESPEIAAVLNRDYVAVKVDREERPDVDRVYMTFVQATTGAGGWPMSVWLTPDLKPFYGGTYFPPTSMFGRPGFVDILREIARAWRDERTSVTASADSIVDRLRTFARMGGQEQAAARQAIPGVDAIRSTVEMFRRAYDSRSGGFGDAPKFPRPSELLLLFRASLLLNDSGARDMALHALRAMALGGMRDHIGGGFHRYSVDRDWRVPHFEKMLYDQAQLVIAYLEAAQITGEREYEETALDTLEYVARDLTDPAGGIYSAEDADSVPPEEAGSTEAHPTEGAFYLWRFDEIGELLGPDADIFRARYGVERDGNAPADPHGEFTGRNILYTARSLAHVAQMMGRTEDDIIAALARARPTLFAARSPRPRPLLDDKVLTAWNGLAIAALARAARTARDRESAGACLDAARRAAAFLQTTMVTGFDGGLRRRWRQGAAAIDGYAEDYAYLVWGLLELFCADGSPAWLEWAATLQGQMDQQFWDETRGGWFSTTGADPSVLLRLKEDYDGAEPAASSVAAMNCLTLAHLTGQSAYAEKADRALAWAADNLAQSGRSAPMMGTALSVRLAGARQVVIVGRAGEPDFEALRDVCAAAYRPFVVWFGVAPGADQERLAAIMPWVGAMSMQDGKATAYACRDFACDAPTTDPSTLRALLEASTP